MLRSKILKLPKLLLFVVCCLVSIGIVVLYSAAGGKWQPWALKQLILFALAFAVSLFITMVNVRTIYLLAYPIYWFCLLLLIGVELLGHTAMGATRWLEIAGFKLQPSEPAKLSIVLMLARYFHDRSLQEIKQWSDLIIPIFASILPCLMIIKQPDLGTGLLTLFSASTLFFVSGMDFRKIALAILAVLLLLPITWGFLHDYQRQRVAIFLNPEQDPLGSGYNLIQSKIAIGSGGFEGKGFMQGTQSHLSFLPEHQTDFIFAFLCEEFGFLGGSCLILLFTMLIGLILAISISCKSVFLKLVTQGAASIIFLHVAINISMVMGLVPVVGVPLPFISYGGTMMVSSMLGIGLIFNACVNKNIRL
jgi:rod shape determining protein RodA